MPGRSRRYPTTLRLFGAVRRLCSHLNREIFALVSPSSVKKAEWESSDGDGVKCLKSFINAQNMQKNEVLVCFSFEYDTFLID